jgi:hypothetical protein
MMTGIRNSIEHKRQNNISYKHKVLLLGLRVHHLLLVLKGVFQQLCTSATASAGSTTASVGSAATSALFAAIPMEVNTSLHLTPNPNFAPGT